MTARVVKAARPCASCGKPFTKRAGAKTCSDRCRRAAARAAVAVSAIADVPNVAQVRQLPTSADERAALRDRIARARIARADADREAVLDRLRVELAREAA